MEYIKIISISLTGFPIDLANTKSKETSIKSLNNNIMTKQMSKLTEPKTMTSSKTKDAVFPKIFSKTYSPLWRAGLDFFPDWLLDQFLSFDPENHGRGYLGPPHHDCRFYPDFGRNTADHHRNYRRDHRPNLL